MPTNTRNQNKSNVRGSTDKKREEHGKMTREEAGRKGGKKVSENQEHMAEIGKKGGEASHKGELGRQKGR